MFKKKRKKKLSLSRPKAELSKSNSGILIAYRKGYRVSDNGNILNPNGVSLSMKASPGKYPTVTITEKNISYNVPVHRLAAYCFYGKEIFRNNVLVRHLNGNVLDVRKSNIALGNSGDNSLDRPLYQRKSVALAGKKAQKRPANAKFTKDDVLTIRRRREEGETLQTIATAFGVTRQAIHRIVIKSNYADIE